MSEENKYTFENEEYRKTYWHTCSHVLAQAVKRLWPEVKLAIGPSIDGGFYYDLDAPFAFTQENLAQIEAEMRKICKEKLKLERFELPREEALKFMEEREEPYKVELINDLPADAHISFYKQGKIRQLLPNDALRHVHALVFALQFGTPLLWIKFLYSPFIIPPLFQKVKRQQHIPAHCIQPTHSAAFPTFSPLCRI